MRRWSGWRGGSTNGRSKLPAAFVAELYEHANLTFQAWEKARPANDFASVRPLLEKQLDYSRRTAEYFAPYEHMMDPLIDFSDYGMTRGADPAAVRAAARPTRAAGGGGHWRRRRSTTRA